MRTEISKIHGQLSARRVRPLVRFNAEQYKDLYRVGIGLDARTVADMRAALDAIQPDVTQGSITTPVQFLENWLPGFVKIVTAPRKIDEFVGIATVGSWEDENIVQGLMELVGTSVPYGDYTNVPFSSWNLNFVTRTLVRFEEGMRVGRLEEKRAARVRVDSAAAKRESAALALEIQRNIIGFFGYNSGNNNTYGFLNDPGLPAYLTAPSGTGGSPHWSTKTYLEIIADIRMLFVALRTQSQDLISGDSVDTTLALATDVVDYLNVTPDFGNSVKDWLTKTYPRCRVVSAPELNFANGGANVGYLYAEKVDDQSSDGGQTFIQVVPSKFQVLGVAQQSKAYEEDYTNATAGIMCKRPYAVVRISGI